MAIRKYSFKTSEQDRGKRLDHVLGLRLAESSAHPVSRAKVRKLIVAGAVYLNGRRVRIASKPVFANAQIDAHVDWEKLESAPALEAFSITADRILYEDDDLIFVDKPPGIPTQPTLDEARVNIYSALKKFLIAREGRGEVYLGLHHRLDRDTSGVMLFTKSKRANAGISEIFSKHIALKVYNALAKRPSRPVPEEWSVTNYLARARKGGKAGRFASVSSGGDHAHTDFRVLQPFSAALWIEAIPRTGRTHQIRVHLSESGMPILGDATYGSGSTDAAPRLMLHAASLTFPHPILKKEISIQSPLPKDFIRCLEALKN